MQKFLESLSDTDRAAVRFAQLILRGQFGNLSPHMIAQIFAAATVPLPDFITEPDALRHAILTVAAPTYNGAASLCYGRHPETGELSLVMIRRNEVGPDGEPYYGITGGFIHPGYFELKLVDGKIEFIVHSGEQQIDGALRERREELLDDQGKPILTSDRTGPVLIDNGIDERPLQNGGTAVGYCAFASALTDEQMAAVFNHGNRMKNDETYRAAVTEKSKGEVVGVELVPLAQAAIMPLEKFKHPHERHAIEVLYDALSCAPTHDPRAALVQRAYGQALAHPTI